MKTPLPLLLACVALLAPPTVVRAQPWSARQRPAPHPAVARIVVPEKNGTSYGSGTLVDARQEYGLVLTNWHVVRDAAGPIQVLFSDGFESAARVVKVDQDWDLAALGIWRPASAPVALAADAPRPGDLLSIAGYGSGQYRMLSGRCTQYVAPGRNLPFEMVELTGAARQGDSGGPIFNERGELAGVLFGATDATTSGSYCGRVRQFLTDVIPPEPPDSAEQWIAARQRDAAAEPAPPQDALDAQWTRRTESAAEIVAARPASSADAAAGYSPLDPLPLAEAPASPGPQALAEAEPPRVAEADAVPARPTSPAQPSRASPIPSADAPPLVELTAAPPLAGLDDEDAADEPDAEEEAAEDRASPAAVKPRTSPAIEARDAAPAADDARGPAADAESAAGALADEPTTDEASGDATIADEAASDAPAEGAAPRTLRLADILPLGETWGEQIKSILAAVGGLVVLSRVMRLFARRPKRVIEVDDREYELVAPRTNRKRRAATRFRFR